MAPVALGKRKRISRHELMQEEESSRPASPASPPSASSSSSEQSDGEDLQAIFRRAFEAKFKPLDVEPKKPKIEKVLEKTEEEESEAESDWSGISSDNGHVEVIEYVDHSNKKDLASRSELKAFMSSKPPSNLLSESTTTKQKTTVPSKSIDEDEDETAHLKNDLALQKLLRDTHILKTASTTSTSLTGPHRHRSTDLTLLSLGAKKSIHTQSKMPMSHRKGIVAKARVREEKRRHEAKENNIVLEKEVKVKKFTKERERGVGGPGVGRFRGGTLKLSKGDVRDITGGGERGGKKGKGKRGRR